MVDLGHDIVQAKSKALKIFEVLLVVLLLCILALRASVTESPSPQSSEHIVSYNMAFYSLVFSAIFLGAFFVWVVAVFWSGSFRYRFSGIEIGLALLLAGEIVSTMAASNVRAAITNSVVLSTSIIGALLLIQLFDMDIKIKLCLAVIAAAGFLNAYQCSEQFFSGNDTLIKQYQQDGDNMLKTLGIEPGSLEQFQFEHRLYSKDVKGYFTTGNSAGSFAIMAFFASVVLLIDNLQKRKQPGFDDWFILMSGAVAAVIGAGLILTHSKGAIFSFIISCGLFALFYFFGKFFNRHRKIIFISAVAAAFIVVLYISSESSAPPGGKSMLVRWQYWQATAKMIKDNFWSGVGGGNFTTYYFRYKLPESIETISDPHNFLLSFLSQYGPTGLLGFLLLLFVPLIKTGFEKTKAEQKEIVPKDFSMYKSAFALLVFAILLVLRPVLLRMPSDVSLSEKASGMFILFFIPAVAFLIGFLLISQGLPIAGRPVAARRGKDKKESALFSPSGRGDLTAAAIVCAIAGVLIHSLVDFAIFEPGVFITFCAFLACLVAYDMNHKTSAPVCSSKITPLCQRLWANGTIRFGHVAAGSFGKIIVSSVCIVIFASVLYFCLLPVAASVHKINKAISFSKADFFDQAHTLLNEAADDDRLSPLAPSLNGQLFIREFLQGRGQAELLEKGRNCFLSAIERNKNSFTDYERLSTLYLVWLSAANGQARNEYLQKSFDNAARAAALYPGSDRLHFTLAQAAVQLGQKELAVENFRKAVEIEDAYRAQFRKMYPGVKIFSRLGEARFSIAKQSIEKPTKKTE